MGDLDVLKDAVERSTEFWNGGKHQEAIEVLDNLIAKAKQETRTLWVQLLSSHAAIIADSMGDLRLARRYCEQAVACDPENALGLYALADILFRQGESDLADQYAGRSYQISAREQSEEGRALVELILKRWPGIKERQR